MAQTKLCQSTVSGKKDESSSLQIEYISWKPSRSEYEEACLQAEKNAPERCAESY